MPADSVRRRSTARLHQEIHSNGLFDGLSINRTPPTEQLTSTLQQADRMMRPEAHAARLHQLHHREQAIWRHVIGLSLTEGA
jgi:hypothetical protein